MLDDGEKFARLCEGYWCQTVASATNRTQRLRKLQKTTELPAADDITKLTRFIHEETWEAVHNGAVERLKKLILAGLILFNKRRPMEVEELKYVDFQRAQEKKETAHSNEIEACRPPKLLLRTGKGSFAKIHYTLSINLS